MKTQDFSCPYCGRTVRASETQPLQSDDYYYPTPRVAVVKTQGYHWIRPDLHLRKDEVCPGSGRIYYVGDANL